MAHKDSNEELEKLLNGVDRTGSEESSNKKDKSRINTADHTYEENEEENDENW